MLEIIAAVLPFPIPMASNYARLTPSEAPPITWRIAAVRAPVMARHRNVTSFVR
jgi:hypothetical protein